MILLAIIEYAILASTFTIAKVAIGHADPLFLTGVRMIASAPLMFLVHFLQKENSFVVKKQDILLFFQTSIFHIFLPFVAEFWALQYVSSAKTAITYALTPFIAAMLSYFLLKKKLTVVQTIGLSIGLLGLMPIFFSGDEKNFLPYEFMHISMPELVLLFAVTSASYAWFIVSDLMKRGYGISLINGIAMLIGGLFSLVSWYIFFGHEHPIKGSLNSFILWTVILIVVANVISFNLYGWLLKHLSITFMSAIGFLCPIFASFYGVVFLKENLGLSHLIALVMVCFGLWLFYREELRKNYSIG
jgi:drug/metabolite transporter (DMT)-like permease